jgi:hypothetical protein
VNSCFSPELEKNRHRLVGLSEKHSAKVREKPTVFCPRQLVVWKIEIIKTNKAAILVKATLTINKQ